MTLYDTEITYDRITKDYSCFVIIDEQKEYIGSAPNYLEGERRCREYAYDHYADRDTPETAAQILMAEPSPADSAVRAHLTYGHLRRDLFAPTYFCACGGRATIVRYGDPDTFLCDHCHADPDPFGPPTIDEEPGPSIEPTCETCNGDGCIPAYGCGDQAGGYADTCQECKGTGRRLLFATATTARQWLAEDWQRDAEARAWSAELLEK